MSPQLKNSQQQELRELLIKNENSYDRRSEDLFAKLEALINQGGEVQFLNNVNLDAALLCFKSINNFQKEQTRQLTENEEDINIEIMNELEVSNEKLLQDIGNLEKQILEIKTKKINYGLAQKHTSKRIVDFEQKIINKRFNFNNIKSQNNIKLNSMLNFAYDQVKSDKVEFKKSYKDIVRHFLERMQQNEAIIKTLQKSIQDKVRESEHKRTKMNVLSTMIEKVELRKRRSEEVSKRNERMKNELRMKVKSIEQEISRGVGKRIESQTQRIGAKKQGYERVYESLLEIINRIVARGDFDSVRDYINQP